MSGEPFSGEWMVCEICGRRELSHVRHQSQWRCLEIDSERGYFCPSEFPPDDRPSDQFTLAYERAIAFLLARRNEQLMQKLKKRRLDRPIDWK